MSNQIYIHLLLKAPYLLFIEKNAIVKTSIILKYKNGKKGKNKEEKTKKKQTAI